MVVFLVSETRVCVSAAATCALQGLGWLCTCSSTEHDNSSFVDIVNCKKCLCKAQDKKNTYRENTKAAVPCPCHGRSMPPKMVSQMLSYSMLYAGLPVTHGTHALSWIQTLMVAEALYFFLQGWYPPCHFSLQQRGRMSL